MPEELVINNVHSTSTNTFGRAINAARTHRFIIDGTSEPAEEITPVEAFLAAVSSCAVQLVERFGREENVPLETVESSIEGARRADEPSRFSYVRITMSLRGATQIQAEHLVDRFKKR